MNRRLSSAALCGALIFISAAAHGLQARAKVDEKVRVKLIHVNFPVDVEGDGLEIRGMKFEAVQKIAIPKREQISLDYKLIHKDRVWIVKKGEVTSRTSEPFVEVLSNSGKITVAGFEVPTPILLAPAGKGPRRRLPKGVDVIAALKLNDYLEGVLSGEMPSGWPIEALKAQAVAARSYTLFQLKTRKKSTYQLEGSVLDQAYVYAMPKPQQEKIKQAIEETDDIVLADAGRIMKAYYHADCGGQTEDPSQIWGGLKSAKKITSVTDEGCAFSPHGKWNYEMSLGELKAKLVNQNAGQNLGELKEVRVVSRTPSRRAALIAFNDGNHDVMVSGNDLRRILGYAKLKSTLFTVTQKQETVQFSGRGFGHGSGLCQWGARFLAEKGVKYGQILKHYYPHAQVTSVALE